MGLNGWSNSMNLLWLGDPKSFDVALVGGKAANLSRLARMYHRVPDGFSLPVTVMDEAHPLDLRDGITAAISDLMACHSLPDFIAAVRSSAVDEDGATASAIVTDTGGELSHSAVVAREYRIPAVVGTGHATSTFHDGELLEVDGDAGTVRVVVEEVEIEETEHEPALVG